MMESTHPHTRSWLGEKDVYEKQPGTSLHFFTRHLYTLFPKSPTDPGGDNVTSHEITLVTRSGKGREKKKRPGSGPVHSLIKMKHTPTWMCPFPAKPSAQASAHLKDTRGLNRRKQKRQLPSSFAAWNVASSHSTPSSHRHPYIPTTGAGLFTTRQALAYLFMTRKKGPERKSFMERGRKGV